MKKSLIFIHIYCLQTFVGGDGDVCDEGVELVWGILILIAFPGQTHTHAVRHIPHSFGPHGLVEACVDADIRSAHLLHCELADLLQGARSSPLEGDAVDALVDVDGVFAGHHFIDGRAALLLLALLGCHSVRWPLQKGTWTRSSS